MPKNIPVNFPLTLRTLNALNGDRTATAAKLGISMCSVRKVAKRAAECGVYVAPSPHTHNPRGAFHEPYCPTPEEIERLKAELKAQHIAAMREREETVQKPRRVPDRSGKRTTRVMVRNNSSGYLIER